MGGFIVAAQPFSIYQAIDWINNANSTLTNQIHGVRRIRSWIEMNAEDVIKLNIVPRLVELMQQTQSPLLQSEIVSTLANVAAGTSRHTKVVLDRALLSLIDCFGSTPENSLKADIIWTLANIAGDSEFCRDKLIDGNVLPMILKLVETPTAEKLEKNVVWFLSNFCRHKVHPSHLSAIFACIPTLKRFLNHINKELVTNACWALKYIADHGDEAIDVLVNGEVCKPIVALVGHSSSVVVCTALLVIVNITAGSKVFHTDKIIEAGFVPAALQLLSSESMSKAFKNCCFALANIAAGEKSQVQAIIDGQVLTKIVQLFPDVDDTTKLEMILVLVHASSNEVDSQLEYLIEIGCSEIFSQSGKAKSSKASAISLWGLSIIDDFKRFKSISSNKKGCISFKLGHSAANRITLCPSPAA